MLELRGKAQTDDKIPVIRTENEELAGHFLYGPDRQWYFAPAGPPLSRDDVSRLSMLFYDVMTARRDAIRAAVSQTSSALLRQMRATKPIGDADDVLG